MTKNVKNHINLLGKHVEDLVTGFTGVVTTVSFDLYGCIQLVVTPYANSDNEIKDCRWFDVTRLRVIINERAMPLPDFDKGYISEGKKGPAEKPIK